MQIYSRYNLPPKKVARIEGESLTQQCFKDEADINVIVGRYTAETAFVDPLTQSQVQASFGDFTTIPDFHAAQNILALANEAFDALPAELRKRFNNDPAEVLYFLNDESNREEAIRLGLVQKVDASISRPDAARISGDAAVGVVKTS